VNLDRANLSDDDLKMAALRVADLTNATTPNGRKYEDWLVEKESRGKDGENSGFL